MATQTATLNIQGMTCGGCVRSVTNALQGADGVEKADVSLSDSKATVAYDPAQTSPQALAELIDDIGFEASVA
ncbi:MAG TPA: heavy metal-associated domain-containing protein [Rhodocyclaceae bacterium]|nr:heavy metal-associated domain-containing protein [Rhodocyclaceae bacterium]